MAKIELSHTLRVRKVRTSRVCESCGGEDRNEFIGFTAGTLLPMIPIALCHFCRSCLYKEIRGNE